jgi:hypothetical protein
MFYSGNRLTLDREVETLLESAPVQPVPGRIIALIVPHAGYMYSGRTAAYVYSLLRGTHVPDVVIVAPSHHEYFDGISVYPGAAYTTPLGTVPVSTTLRAELLAACPFVQATLAGHGPEHAVEVQLPFLQKVLGTTRILPLVVGNQSRSVCFGLGEALGLILQGTEAVLVASTDLSHFHPAKVAEQMDRVVAGDLEQFDPEQLMDDIEAGHVEACGGGPTVAVLVAARKLGARSVRVLHRTHSGAITGDNRSVVGYLAAVAVA